MATFDIETFLAQKGQGSGQFAAIGASFGMPSCLINLSQQTLSLLPSNILGQLESKLFGSGNKADEVVKKFFKKVTLLTSIMEVGTEDGSVQYISDSSEFGLDKNEELESNQSGGFLDAVETAAAGAGQIYRNIQTGKEQLEIIQTCLGKYDDMLKYSGGESVNQRASLQITDPSAAASHLDQRFRSERQAADSALVFMDDVSNTLKEINTIRQARTANPSLEPILLPEFSDLSGLGFKVDIEGDEPEPDEIFRLVFGPPRSITGQFLLSIDGLYFDSQTSGIKPALKSLQRSASSIEIEDYWKLEFDPNLGGRGIEINSDDLVNYIGTLFDPEIIDDSDQLRLYYDADRFLQALIGQKGKRIHDLSGHINQYEMSGVSTAIVTNTRQTLISEGSLFDNKINRRKKQIEIAVKVPAIYGSGPMFNLGEIPVNDFGYLKEINLGVALEKQRKLILDTDSVSGVVKPLPIKFVFAPRSNTDTTAQHLYVTMVGKGSIIYDSKDPESVSGTTLAISDVVVLDRLLAMYNFLQTDVVGPKSTKFLTQNDAVDDNKNNAQLVANEASAVFASGVAVPILRGISNQSSNNILLPSGTGSYVKLPDTSEFQDFMYSREGFTIESWVHMPNFNSVAGFANNGASGLYRLILANENTGLASGITAQTDVHNISKDDSTNVTQGFIMGFTRDRRITKKQSASNEFDANSPASSLAFFMAPTQSINEGEIGFMRKFVDDECVENDGYYSMKLDASTTHATGVALSSLCKEYMHIAVTVDPTVDECKIYVDSKLMTTSSVTGVFGTKKFHPVNLPTFKNSNSFEWAAYGPKLDTFFTPWIVGGGYTDGLAASGNFMGGDFGGVTSGLKGNLGSIKFYTKPLTIEEVLTNYNAQKDLFKNISVPFTCWEVV